MNKDKEDRLYRQRRGVTNKAGFEMELGRERTKKK